MKYVAVVLFDPRYALKDHHYCAPFGAHINGLEGGIQD